jgi:hypothetical protein
VTLAQKWIPPNLIIVKNLETFNTGLLYVAISWQKLKGPYLNNDLDKAKQCSKSCRVNIVTFAYIVG